GLVRRRVQQRIPVFFLTVLLPAVCRERRVGVGRRPFLRSAVPGRVVPRARGDQPHRGGDPGGDPDPCAPLWTDLLVRAGCTGPPTPPRSFGGGGQRTPRCTRGQGGRSPGGRCLLPARDFAFAGRDQRRGPGSVRRTGTGRGPGPRTGAPTSTTRLGAVAVLLPQTCLPARTVDQHLLRDRRAAHRDVRRRPGTSYEFPA